MKITILGCGASTGIPVIGCSCAVCKSANPKNKRSRVSAVVEHDGRKLLIDTGPDLRQQFLANDFKMVDAIVYTHAHADHLHGIDDVRSINFHLEAPVPAYMDEATHNTIKARFPYVFQLPPKEIGWYRPCLEATTFKTGETFKAAGMDVRSFSQIHGKGTSTGLRIGDFAYSTDTNGLTEDAFKVLDGVRVWVVDCLRYDPAPTHAHLELTLEWIRRVKPERAVLTHMAHDFDYDMLRKELPAGTEPGYDGMVIEL